MKSGLTVKLGMAIAGVLLAGTALAQGPGGGMNGGRGPGAGFGEHRPPMEQAFGSHGDHGRWWNNPKMVAELKLTDDQRKAMDGILLEHREKLIDLHADLEKAELQMEPLMKEDQPNESQILAQIDKVAQARAELEKANARFLLAIRSKLTPEQWKQMEADRARRGQRGGWDKDGHGRDGHGDGHGADGRRGPGGQGHGNWQPGGQHHGQMPPPAGGGQGSAPPPAGPQSMVDGAAAPVAPPVPVEGAGAVQ